MTRTQQGTIYALIDPRDNKIRYIGKTEKPILARLASHLATPTNPVMRVWINALSLQGLTPRIQPIATVPVAQLEVEEKRQIEQHAAAGHRLWNAPYYHQNLADLGQQTTALPQRAQIADEGLSRWAYGPLARARVNGEAPAWLAFVTVVCGAPVFLALLVTRAVLRPLFCTRPGLRLLMAGAAGLVLWDAGFDAAVREVLLPQLPIAQWSEFWDAYMSGPLVKLATDSVWPLVMASVAVAGSEYAEIAKTAGLPNN